MNISARLLSSLLFALALLFAPAWVGAQLPTAGASGALAPAASLPELPRLQPITFPEPDPTALKELERLLERLGSEDERARTDARSAIGEVGPSIVPAVRHRVRDVQASIDREAAARVLEAARKVGRKARKGKEDGKPAEGKGDKKGKVRKDDEGDDGDWLDFLLANPHPGDKSWQDLVRIYGMTRMLATVGTTPAVREMVQLYAHFGDLVRIDLQRQIAKLRDKAVPALIEARQHDAKVVERWANKELDVLGRAIPGEAVASNDTQILADVLRAYGRTRDVDAARVILSFCNSDRVQLRDAARESLAAIGEAGVWQIRDQYLGLTGEKPPRAWTWDRLARELFALYDRQRLAEIHKLMDEGAAAAGAGDVAAAVDAFDKVLARAPLFERRREMAAAYIARAGQLEDGHRDEAMAMMRKALRLDPQGERARNVEARIACLEGELSVEQGAPDRTAFERALTLDAASECARRGLASLEEKAIERQSYVKRYVGAAAVGVAALIAMLVLARRRPRASAPAPVTTEGAAPPPTPPG
jgi:tetratricopeptide (TPR) repeat protein